MKHLILALLILLPTVAFAADRHETYRNTHGDEIGSSDRHSDVRDYRDGYGNWSGSATDDGNGSVVIRDRYGDIIGEVERDDD